jgi:hypothetical protein
LLDGQLSEMLFDLIRFAGRNLSVPTVLEVPADVPDDMVIDEWVTSRKI